MRRLGDLALVMTIGLTGCSSSGGGHGGNPDGGGPDASAGAQSTGGRGSGGKNSAGSGGTQSRHDGGSGGGQDTGGTNGNGGSANGGTSSGGMNGGGDTSGGGGTGGGGVPEASACAPCPSGICLENNVCAECGKDADCHDAKPRCNVSAHECVACLPGDSDNCGDGQYCDGSDLTCKSGCKNSASCGTGFCNAAHVCLDCNPNGADTCVDGKFCTSAGACVAGCKTDGSGCASNVCQGSHECQSCIADSECLPGHVCSSGQCLPDCGHDNDCPTGFTCCGDRCADLSRDHSACLACGTTCTATQFCASAGCRDATIASVCDSARATFLKDGLNIDDAQDDVLSAGLVAGCATKPTVTSPKLTDAVTINPTTGQPVVGSGDMQVVVGGPFGQALIKYLDNAGVTPAYSTYDNMREQFRLRSGGTPPVDVAGSTDGHDWVLIETVVDPKTGTLMFAVDGFQQQGTIAGVWYFVNTMLPSLSTYTKSYYIYEWTDGDGDKAPSSADTFTLVASGP